MDGKVSTGTECDSRVGDGEVVGRELSEQEESEERLFIIIIWLELVA